MSDLIETLKRLESDVQGDYLLYIKSDIKYHTLQNARSGIEFLCMELRIHGQNIMFSLTYALPFVYELFLNYVSEMEKIVNNFKDDVMNRLR